MPSVSRLAVPAPARLLESLRPPMPPIVVVQHMPAGLTKPLASRRDPLGELSVREAANEDLLEPNHVLIAPAENNLPVRPPTLDFTVKRPSLS